ncbi:MAG: TIM-barrel domain-containing protein, partial [Verrucomicrobiia bacterium]
MKPSLFFLDDLLDLNAPEAASDVVWRAMRPVTATSEGGVATLQVPFEKLVQATGEEASVAKNLPLLIRAYGDRVVRISLGGGQAENHPIFAWDESLALEPLHWELADEAWTLVDTKGRRRGRIPRRDSPVVHWSNLVAGPAAVLEGEWWPDGERSIALAARDTFTPSARQTGSIGLGMVERAGIPHRWTWSLAAAPGERFAGTGERFCRMNLAGGTYLLENTDALGVNSPRAYKNVPFYLSSRGYGLLVAGSGSTRLSLAGISTRAACGVIEEPVLDLFLIAGTPEQIVREYRRMTGFPAKPPLWSFGTWMARMTYFSAAEVENVGRRMREGKFPCDVIHLDTGWFRTDWKCEWEFSPERFPDPEGFLRRMRDSGFRISLWQLPVIARGTKHWEEATAKGYVAPPRDTSEVAGSDFGGGSSDAASIDFTNPEAVTWYQGLLAELFRKGASAIKTDFGENIDLRAHYQGMPAERLRN